MKNEYVVFTAHLDHDGVGDEIDGDGIYNGAVDNASGTAVVLEVARALSHHPPKTLNHLRRRHGRGNRAWSDRTTWPGYPARPIDQIVANINIDGALFFFDFADVLAWGSESFLAREKMYAG